MKGTCISILCSACNMNPTINLSLFAGGLPQRSDFGMASKKGQVQSSQPCHVVMALEWEHLVNCHAHGLKFAAGSQPGHHIRVYLHVTCTIPNRF